MSKKIHNILNKFSNLCWDAFMDIMGYIHMQYAGNRVNIP